MDTDVREIGNKERPGAEPQDRSESTASLGDGVAVVRRALAEATTPPRWPMYPRQFKQFLRTVQPDFDERRFGSIAELMRACQKDGILRLERDRQGALRVFSNAATASKSLPHGWGLVVNAAPVLDDSGEGPSPGNEALPAPVVIDAEVEEIDEAETSGPEPGNEAEPTARAAKPKRATRARKAPAAAAEKKKAPVARKRKSPAR